MHHVSLMQLIYVCCLMKVKMCYLFLQLKLYIIYYILVLYICLQSLRIAKRNRSINAWNSCREIQKSQVFNLPSFLIGYLDFIFSV